MADKKFQIKNSTVDFLVFTKQSSRISWICSKGNSDCRIIINGQIFDEEYFEHLLDEIKEIHASEREFYQKITDIYATAVDYSKDAVTTKEFFKTVQNKLYYAIHGHTTAEVIVESAEHKKDYMGLTTWKNAPDGKIVKSDVSIAK